MFGRKRAKDLSRQGGDRESSDKLYAAGEWDVLRSMRELSRYSLIAGYCAQIGARSVLDVGCGEGLLAERLQRPPLVDYVGLEVSPVAVRQAQAKALPGCRFVVAEAQDYAPDSPFDAIVFNEMLYYLTEPQAVVAQLAQALTPEGRLIVSVHQAKGRQWVWDRLASGFTVEDHVTVRHASGVAWDVKLMRPAGGYSA